LAERILRRELEAENRRLKREISEAKWRDRYLFIGIYGTVHITLTYICKQVW
jgi:hypothetical protein